MPAESDNDTWDEVLNEALKACARFWDGKSYDGFQITVDRFLTTNPKINEIKSTHQLLKSFSNASKRKMKNSASFQYLQKKYQHFVKHCNHKPFQIEFVRCEDLHC